MVYTFAELVYKTLVGMLEGDYAVIGVRNAFQQGSYCLEKYDEVFRANCRLCERLGAETDDEDVECIINSMMEIQERLSIEMFYLGLHFAGYNRHSIRIREYPYPKCYPEKCCDEGTQSNTDNPKILRFRSE